MKKHIAIILAILFAVSIPVICYCTSPSSDSDASLLPYQRRQKERYESLSIADQLSEGTDSRWRLTSADGTIQDFDVKSYSSSRSSLTSTWLLVHVKFADDSEAWASMTIDAWRAAKVGDTVQVYHGVYKAPSLHDVATYAVIYP